MKPMNEPAKRMVKAIEYLTKHGWCPDEASNNAGKVCLLIAMLKVGIGSGSEDPCIQAVSNVIQNLYPAHYRENDIGHFNDHPNITRADVDRVMQHALVTLIQEGAG